MSTWFKEKFEKLEQKGRAEGRADGVLRVLAVRGVPVDDMTRQRILSCTDLSTLDRWLERAVKASSVSEVLADPA